MADAKFEPTAELLIDGVWTDVTSDVRQAAGIQIDRGQSDQADAADPARCSLTFSNPDGKYSPRNPMSPYHGKIGRNTAIRVKMPSTLSNYLALPGGRAQDAGVAWSSYASTPDDASLDIVGDIDIRIEVDPETWRPAVTYGLMQKYAPLDVDTYAWSWALALTPDGYLSFRWTPDWGTGGASTTVLSTVSIDSDSPKLALRVTLDVNNGAGGNDVKFYTDTNINGSYTQLGATVTTAGVTSIDTSDAPIEIGRSDLHTGGTTTGPDLLLQGKVYRAQVRSGLAGALVASPDFTTLDSGDTSLIDAQSRTWSLNGRAAIADPSARFHGEVSAWPPRWDKAHSDVNVPIEAYGILRRLGRGQIPKKSTMHQAMSNSPGVRQYWPCEDGEDSTSLASALPNMPAIKQYGTLANAAFDGFASSEALPTLSDGHWVGNIPAYENTDTIQASFLLAVPSGGIGCTAFFRIRTTGGGSVVVPTPRWDLDITTSGQLRLRAFNDIDVQVHDSGNLSFGLNGKLVRVTLKLRRIGSDIRWNLSVLQIGATTATVFTGTVTGRTMGAAVRIGVAVGTVSSSIDGTAIGHIAILDHTTPAEVLLDELNAFNGEVAGSRILRLCQDEGIPVLIEGDAADTARLGPQRAATFLELIQEAANADLGILYEPRDLLGVAYRTRASLYSQEVAVSIDYESEALEALEPVEDDDATRNDITVTRIGGSSTRVQQETGPLSVSPPPAGVGRYEDDTTLSLFDDSDTPNQAGWRLHLGTVDEARYPVVSTDLAKPAFTSDPGMRAEVENAGIGARLTITNVPVWGSPSDVDQLIQGVSERIGQYEWVLDFNCTPASPWDVGVWNEPSGPGEARWSSLGTYLTADVPASGRALVLNGVSPGCASTPDAASLDITGDIDVRVHVAMDDWTPAANSVLCSKWTATGNQRHWAFLVLTTGVLRFQWTTGGITTLTLDSSVAPTVANGAPLWVRVAFDVDNGASGRTATFYTSTDGNTWTQLGTPATSAGVTSIHSGSAPLIVSGIDVGTNARLSGKVSAVEVRNGIAGTRVARPEFGAQPAGTTSFTDAQGNVWTINSPAAISGVADGFFPATLFVSTPRGPVWGASDAPYDLVLDGERVTLTALTGTDVAQVLTVTRSAGPSHATGAEVTLWKPAVYAL